MENKIFSFIIASVDRDEQLLQCISSIEKAHEYKKNIPVEILVVIQKSKQNKDIKLRYPDMTAFYYIDKLGLSVARNFAIDKSTGDYLVFIDDDATVKEEFIEVLMNNVQHYNDIGAFCGRLLDPVQHVPFTHIFNLNKAKKLGRLDYKYFMGSAHVLSRKMINKIGCYDERFGVGSKYLGSEESDIFFRLKKANEPVLYLPDLVFLHPMLVVPPSYVYKYAYAVGAALTKSCLEDKPHFIVYFFIVLQIIIKARYINLTHPSTYLHSRICLQSINCVPQAFLLFVN